jgi:hypothetical protein
VTRDRGSAVVDFVLVTPILLVLLAAVLQVLLMLHVRALLTSAAAEGARAAALAGADPEAGIARAEQLLDGTLADGVDRRIRVRGAVQEGLPVLVLHIDATVPLLGLLPPVDVSVEGRALREGW